MGKFLKHPYSTLIPLLPASTHDLCGGTCALESLLQNFLSPSLVFWTSWVWQCHLGGVPRAQTGTCTDSLFLSFRVLLIFYPICGVDQMPQDSYYGIVLGPKSQVIVPECQSGRHISPARKYSISCVRSCELGSPEWCRQTDFGWLKYLPRVCTPYGWLC